MKINFERIATQLHVDAGDLLVKATVLNKKHKLGIDDFGSVTGVEYDLVRSLLDADYLVRLLGKGPSDRKYNYNQSPGFNALEDWLSEQGNMDGLSTRYLQSVMPGHVGSHGQQVLSAAMRNLGYSIKRVEVDGKIARRWFKKEEEVSFL